MKVVSAYWYFYKNIFVVTTVLSTVVAVLMGFSFKTFALSYLLFNPFFHFMIYEIRNKNEYYFYANFGLSRMFLWVMTLLISFILHFFA